MQLALEDMRIKHKITWHPEPNNTVRVCYDGKHGRCEVGAIIAVAGNSIRVRFIEWGNDNQLIAWFNRTNSQSFGAFVKVDVSVMDMMFKCGGDWYSVYPDNSNESNE
jgi:hypothetical protein